jgi:hypothetical protein
VQTTAGFTQEMKQTSAKTGLTTIATDSSIVKIRAVPMILSV